MACPYFFPTEKNLGLQWLFPGRLPLGAGFSGTCLAGTERVTPNDRELRDLCNLGYALQCARFPAERASDAIRFAIAKDNGSRILLRFCCERDHAPVQHGQLEYDRVSSAWLTSHSDTCLLRQAECYISTYLERRK